MIRPPRSSDIRTVADADIGPRTPRSMPARTALARTALPFIAPPLDVGHEGLRTEGRFGRKTGPLVQTEKLGNLRGRPHRVAGATGVAPLHGCAVAQPRLRSTMGRPSLGFSVTRCRGQTAWPGFSSKVKWRMMRARTRVASCKAKAEPMQMRAPTPNGR